MICLSTLLTWFLAHVIYLTLDGFRNDAQKADCVLILGTKVNEDGTLSEHLLERMLCGTEAYRHDQCKYVIVSGGTGKEGHPEAEVMRNFLLKQGVPDSVIIVDNHGYNTTESVKFASAFVQSHRLSNIRIVSQYFHITRTKMLFRRQGPLTLYSSAPYYFSIRDLYSVPREFVAFYVQSFFS